LKFWVFVTKVKDEFILGLDVHDALLLGASCDTTGPRSVAVEKRSTATINQPLARNELIPSKCKRVVTERLDVPMGEANGLVIPGLKTSHMELHTARTLVRARQKTPVRIENMSDQIQVLAVGTTLGRCEPTSWTAPIDDLEPQYQRTEDSVRSCNQRVVSGARPNLCTREVQKFEKFITEFHNTFATKSGE
jgi:hypothetical protein